MKRLGKIKALSLTALAAVALSAPLVLAQTSSDTQEGARGARAERRGGRGGHFGGGRFGGRQFAGIELTDEQKARLQEIRQSFGERTRTLREQLRAKQHEARQAGQGTTFDEALAAQKLTEAAALQARLWAEEFRLRQESLAILTPEQRTSLEQRRAEFEARRGERRERRQRPEQQ
jgi:Spy/CpxP family protein refolding chaperone